MTKPSVAWPAKTRELHNAHMDSTIWNRFRFRDDDVIVGTYAKSGTTWTQQIVGQLVFAGAPDVPIADISPWLDLRIMPPDTMERLEAQTHRRIVKTHLPLDALKRLPGELNDLGIRRRRGHPCPASFRTKQSNHRG